tara:strand:+ start:1148 stop:2395 length:1248 start_codon:yes stop_codon:yes gene_type:complete
MEDIYNTDSNFDFTKLKLAKPVQIPGGNYFIRVSMNNKALYIQPPKSKTKQGFLKAGKRYYTDLMFSNVDSNFIEWMENLENHCQQMLYQNREQWFEDSMEIHEIENYFTSPLRIFKSGKFYIARVVINTNLGKPLLKIYDEDENLINMDQVDDKVNIMSILEIKGIKCSATSFQIEIEIKQMMVLKPENLFEKCLFKTNHAISMKTEENLTSIDNDVVNEEDIQNVEEDVATSSPDKHNETKHSEQDNLPDDEVLIEDVEDENNDENIVLDTKTEEQNIHDSDIKLLENQETTEETENTLETLDNNLIENNSIEDEKNEDSILENEKDLENQEINELQEINVSLDEIPEQNSISIKNKDNVYYQMYKEAKSKAKVARDLAISSYLEAKRIKNLYMLDETTDTDDSDFENMDPET